MRYLGHRTFSLPLLLTAVLAACGPSGGPQGGAPGGFPPAPVSVMAAPAANQRSGQARPSIAGPEETTGLPFDRHHVRSAALPRVRPIAW